MPNHVENDLKVTGPVEEIERFKRVLFDAVKAAVAAGEGSGLRLLRALYPMPEELRGTTSPTQPGEEEKAALLKEKYGASDWYEWACANWGTKWGDYDTELVRETHNNKKKTVTLYFKFLSAWSPPREGLATVGEKWPLLTFDDRYYEGGGGFQGHLRIEKGEVTEDDSWEYRGRRGG